MAWHGVPIRFFRSFKTDMELSHVPEVFPKCVAASRVLFRDALTFAFIASDLRSLYDECVCVRECSAQFFSLSHSFACVHF